MDQNDLFNMMQQAMAFKKTLDPTDGSTDKKSNDIDFNKIMQIMEIVKMFGNNKPPQTESPSEPQVVSAIEAEPQITPFKSLDQPFFDEPIFTPSLKSLKAIIPYLHVKQQKNMALVVKFIELQKTKELYEGIEIESTEETQDKDWHRNMLQAIKPHMDHEKRNFIDVIEKVIEINELMDKIKEMKTNT